MPQLQLPFCLWKSVAAVVGAGIGIGVGPGMSAAWAQDKASPNAGMRFAAASLQQDARQNRVAEAVVSLPVGERAWFQLGGGQSRSRQDAFAHEPGLLNAGLGMTDGTWRAAVQTAYRRDGDLFRQNDVSLALDWQGSIFKLGIEGSHRRARVQGRMAAASAPGGTPAAPVQQRLRGGGIGVRGGADVGSALSVYASAARYRYRETTTQAGSAPSGGGLLGGPLLLGPALQSRASAITRSESALSRSLQMGATYRWARVAVSAEVLADRVLDTPGTVRTAQARAAIDVTPAWTVTPLLGRTRSAAQGGVSFAGITVNHAW